MRIVNAAINVTLDGVCDHTVGIADEELHRHYEELIDSAGIKLCNSGVTLIYLKPQSA